MFNTVGLICMKTAGAQSKFGIPIEELDEVARLATKGGVIIDGLHAHAGSGVFDVENWSQVGSVLVGLVKRFPDHCAHTPYSTLFSFF